MAVHFVKLTDDELEAIVVACQDAQQELCCGPTFPEANSWWERWEQIIQRFKNRVVKK